MRKQITILVLCMSLTACATIFDRTNDNITFTSEPVEAKIFLNGRFIGKTPTSVQVSRSLFSGGPPNITIEKDGYKGQAFELSKEFNKVAIFNLTFIFSWATDVVSGAVMRYSPTDYRIFLEEDKKQEDKKLEAPAAYRPQDTEMIKFVLFNFERIQEDIAKRGGEYLESMVLLVTPVDKPVDKKDLLIKKILHDSEYLKGDSASKMIGLLKRDKQF